MGSRRDGEKPNRERAKERRTPLERMISGLVVGLGFGALAILKPEFGWAGFVAIFAGLIPFTLGLRGFVEERARAPARKKLDAAERSAQAERSILRIAQEHAGRVTPALVALGSELSLEEADRTLQTMVTKGYAAMQVREDGRIEYEFREFMSLPSP